MNEVKVYIDEKYATNTYQIWVIRHEYNCDVYYNLENGEIVETTVEHNTCLSTLSPFIEMPRMFAQMLIRQITEYGKQKGMATENENHIKGKLEATELHLSDMREINEQILHAFLKTQKEK